MDKKLKLDSYYKSPKTIALLPTEIINHFN